MPLTPADTGDDLGLPPFRLAAAPAPAVPEAPYHRGHHTIRHRFSLGEVPLPTYERTGVQEFVRMTSAWADRIELLIHAEDVPFWIERFEEIREELSRRGLGGERETG